jgi:anti-sigma regulatory factor (Ser/Thr protein kinase)
MDMLPSGAKWAGDRPIPALAELDHCALFYRDTDEFLAGTGEFIQAGLASREPVLVAVRNCQAELLRDALNGSSQHVSFIDMDELGRNPGRIIPAAREWIDSQDAGRVRFVSEPVWAACGEREIVEAMRHEALVNLAFADAPMTILCSYDTGALDPQVLSDAQRTHPHVMCDGRSTDSRYYTDPLEVWRAHDFTLPDPPPSASTMTIGNDLTLVRSFVHDEASKRGVSEARCTDLILAANEAATNALLHGSGGRTVGVWEVGGRVTCEIFDHGWLEDPLAGRRRPSPLSERGRGVWLMNQLCDLVELRPGMQGTTIRLHVDTAS